MSQASCAGLNLSWSSHTPPCEDAVPSDPSRARRWQPSGRRYPLSATLVFDTVTIGLNSGLGIVRADARGRQSPALDSTPSNRPGRGRLLCIALVEHGTFRNVDFVDTTDGHVCIPSPLTHELAQMMPRWAQALPRLLREELKEPGRSSSPSDGGEGHRTPRQTTGQARPHERWRRRCAENACPG